MPKVLEITPDGARAASLAENRDNLNRRQREELGEDLSLSEQTPQSQWSGIAALNFTEMGEGGVRAALYGSSVDHSEGVHLDAHGSLLDIRRRVATFSRVTATLTGVAGVGVPEGSRAKTSAGAVFETEAAVTLSPSGVTVEMQAIEAGPVEAPAGTLTQIGTIIPGWETITNAAAASVGVIRQSDDAYKASYRTRTAHSSRGPIPALEGAIEEALAGKQRVVENDEDTGMFIQEWRVGPHAVLAFSEGGSDGDVRRAVENHRGMGAGTMSAIRGGTPDDTALAAVSDGTVNWNGTAYTGLDLSSLGGPVATVTTTAGTGAAFEIIIEDGAIVEIRVTNGGSGYASGDTVAITGGAGTGATATLTVDAGAITAVTVTAVGADYESSGKRKAAALTTLLASDAVPPTILFVGGAYVAQFRWRPDRDPRFGTATVEDAFALDPDTAAYPAGPFVRPRTVDLDVSFTLGRRPGFPANGLATARENVLLRVVGYEAAVRAIPGIADRQDAASLVAVRGYGIGEQIWANDLLCEAERVAGTRVTNLVVEVNGRPVSGRAVPLDQLWSLGLANLAITVA